MVTAPPELTKTNQQPDFLTDDVRMEKGIRSSPAQTASQQNKTGKKGNKDPPPTTPARNPMRSTSRASKAQSPRSSTGKRKHYRTSTVWNEVVSVWSEFLQHGFNAPIEAERVPSSSHYSQFQDDNSVVEKGASTATPAKIESTPEQRRSTPDRRKRKSRSKRMEDNHDHRSMPV